MVGSSRLVARRAAGHLGVLLTATLTALVAAVLLVSATVMAPSVAENALQHTLTNAPARDTALNASTGFDEKWPDLDGEVRDLVARTPGLVDGVTATISSSAFSAAGAAPDDRVVVAMVSELAEHADLTEGAWPVSGAAPSDGPVESVVHAAAANRLDLAVGDTLSVQPLTGSGAPVETVVAGLYLPRDTTDPVWSGNGEGVHPADSDQLTIVGPVLFDADDFLERVAPSSATATWRLPLDTGSVTIANAGRVGAELDELAVDLDELRADNLREQMAVTGSVRELVSDAREAASSARALLLVIVAMLTVLGIWALAFTARLVATRRAPATALLRARGADEGRLLRWSLAGSIVPAVAVALAAPPLAQLALRPVRELGTTALDTAGWIVAAALAALWLMLMVTADVRAGQSMSGVAAENARPRRAAAQRAGLDLVLLALGLVGLQQLRRPAAATPEIVLVVAPALLVLAGTVVLVRALPWVSGAVAGLARTRRGAAAMLGATETARRSIRHVAASVLVILAITVAVFAATTQSTWTTHSSTTVDVSEPADVRIRVAGNSPDEMHTLEAALTDLDGVQHAMPVIRRHYTESDAAVTVLGIDAAEAGEVVRWSPAVAGDDPAARLALLTEDANDDALPVLVTSGLARALGLAVGDVTAIPVSGQRVNIVVAATVDAVPGVPEPLAILADRTALISRIDAQVPDDQESASTYALPEEWWLAAADASDARDLATAVAGLTGVVDVTTHGEAARASADDPAAVGLITGLTAGLLFAALFVVIGVIVHTVTSFQSRAGEYAVVRAIGLGRRELAGTVTVEQGMLLGFSTLAGVGLGVVVAWLVVPHTIGGLTTLADVPPLRLHIPWASVLLLVGAVAVLTAVLVALQTGMTRRIDVAAVLRAGEDT